MEFTLTKIAELIGGKVEGDENAIVHKLCKIEEGCEGGVSFLANTMYANYLYNTKATVVIINDNFILEAPVDCNLIRVPNAYHAFAQLLDFYNEIQHNKIGISSLAFIGKNTSIGKNVYIGEFAVICDGAILEDNVKIYPQTYIGDNTIVKENTVVFAGAKIYSDNEIGRNCVIHSGAVIGADGFGFSPNDGSYQKVSQIGNVILRDHVEVGANTCIDRATLGSTIIEEGVKLDNLIQIAHNVVVGKNTVMASQVGVAGSTKIGANCMFGGQVGITGHAQIANGVMCAAQTGIASSLTQENSIFMGSPGMEAGEYKRSFIHYRNLPKIVKRIDELERKLEKLAK